MEPEDAVTRILDARDGEPEAIAEQLFPFVYDDLRRVARKLVDREPAGLTLQPTALVHEAYIRLVGSADEPRWRDHEHFFTVAARAMRRILVDASRRRGAERRGGDMQRVSLHDAIGDGPSPIDRVSAIDEALERLEARDPDAARVVLLRYFAGLTIEDTASVVGVSVRTAKRRWEFARAWLVSELRRATPPC